MVLLSFVHIQNKLADQRVVGDPTDGVMPICLLRVQKKGKVTPSPNISNHAVADTGP